MAHLTRAHKDRNGSGKKLSNQRGFSALEVLSAADEDSPSTLLLFAVLDLKVSFSWFANWTRNCVMIQRASTMGKLFMGAIENRMSSPNKVAAISNLKRILRGENEI